MSGKQSLGSLPPPSLGSTMLAFLFNDLSSSMQEHIQGIPDYVSEKSFIGILLLLDGKMPWLSRPVPCARAHTSDAYATPELQVAMAKHFRRQGRGTRQQQQDEQPGPKRADQKQSSQSQL